jgi:hypothetical protein
MLAFGMEARQLSSGLMIKYLIAVISMTYKPIRPRVERLVPHSCAAELRALRWATGQSGSG